MPETPQPLPGTEALTLEGDLPAKMVDGLDRFLTREIEASRSRRAALWQRDLSSHAAYARSIDANRQRFLRRIGALDPREPVTALQLVATTEEPALAGQGPAFQAFHVRWPVLPGVSGEGLLLEPDHPPLADVVALPDCDTTPEAFAGLTADLPPQAQLARRLVEHGCRVLIPTLIDRCDTYSGNPRIRMTNQPHREFIYRAAFELGRHIIGFEVQKVLAAVDWFSAEAGAHGRIGVAGAGEGGLLALYSAAADERITAAWVSGYFQEREAVWREPIYRNVFGLLEEFGDAELASLIAPRALVVEACRAPEVPGPPPPSPERTGAAPGALTTPPLASVEAEVARARELTAGLNPSPVLELVASDGGHGLPGSDGALTAFLRGLGVDERRTTNDQRPTMTTTLPMAGEAPPGNAASPLAAPPSSFVVRRSSFVEARARRQFDALLEHTQSLMREAEFRREQFWAQADATDVETWQASTEPYREYLWDEVIGRFPPASVPPNPRTRLLYDEPSYRGYEVVLDVWPDVIASGILLIPKEVREGERRPVVVCQHGLEGRARDVADPSVNNPSYNRFACRLAERGFVTYAPQNPYIGGDRFRVLQRKANPLKKSLFALIVRQHERTLEWLSSLPCVDPQRIAFYGLSYGGKTAMRVPALLEQYCLSICSADYNEWIWKNASVRHRYSYMFTGEYEMFEFDLGNTFNYAEMSGLICPRPFMVERGHHDGVAPDEWVAYEYARTQRRYDLLGLADRTRIEIFNGPHTIHGEGTFAFLHEQLRWPEEH